MLRFFRQIRKQLMEQPSTGRTGNKTRSYLLYALGEIMLVMIGILLALQINNWNEERKIRDSEQDILQNLKSELIINRDELELYRSIHLSEFRSGIYLLNLFNTDISNIPVIKLDSALANVEGNWTFEANDGYIKSIIASGKIDHIRNVELKSLLTSFDGMVIDATQENIPVQRLLHERLWPVIDARISTLNRLRVFEMFSSDFPPGTYKSDYSWFFSSREMEDVISNITSWKKNVVDDELEFKESIDRMLLIIENELN